MFRRVLSHVVFGGIVTSVAVAQTDRRWTELVDALQDAKRRDWSVQQMDRIGARSLQRLISRARSIKDPVVLRAFFYAMSELAHHCETVDCRNLVRLEQAVPKETLPDLFNVQLTAMPFLDSFESEENTKRIEKLAFDAIAPGQGDVSNRYWVAYRRSLQLGVVLRREERRRKTRRYPPLRPDLSTAELTAELFPNGMADRSEAAARLLSRRGRKAQSTIPKLLVLLRSKGPRFPLLRRSSLHPGDHKINRWAAVALTEIAPGTKAAAEGHGYLLLHGNVIERRRAIRAIREHARCSASAVPYLIRSLARRFSTFERRESITTLGILGRHASAAVQLLEILTENGEPSLAASARAALRSIRTNVKKRAPGQRRRILVRGLHRDRVVVAPEPRSGRWHDVGVEGSSDHVRSVIEVEDFLCGRHAREAKSDLGVVRVS